jgi:hypothetical protein
MDKCPCCNRAPEEIIHFPEIFVSKVSVMKPEDIPGFVSYKNGRKNYSQQIKELLQNRSVLKDYVIGLDLFVNETIPAKRVSPKWHVNGQEIPGTEDLSLYLLEGEKTGKHSPAEQRRTSELILFAKNEAGIPHQILKLGIVEYIGLFYAMPAAAEK